MKPLLMDRWSKMKSRCLNRNDFRFVHYGARGIKVCKRWMTYKNFETDMLPTFKKGLTLERIDNNGNYSPGNCKWATWHEQANNKRNNKPIAHNGKTMNLREWGEFTGIGESLLYARLYKLNWSIKKALTLPADTRPKKDIAFRGMTMNLSQWAKFLGVKRDMLKSRISNRHWPIEKALTYNI